MGEESSQCLSTNLRVAIRTRQIWHPPLARDRGQNETPDANDQLLSYINHLKLLATIRFWHLGVRNSVAPCKKNNWDIDVRRIRDHFTTLIFLPTSSWYSELNPLRRQIPLLFHLQYTSLITKKENHQGALNCQ